MDRTVDIVVTGTANLASVHAAFERLGYQPRLIESIEQLEASQRLLLPGVGTLVAARQRLEADGFWAPLSKRLQAGRPTLAICLGLQLLASESEECPGVAGFGLVPAVARRFPASVRVPHIGWNKVQPSTGWLDEGYAYFANSYALQADPGDGWTISWSHHALPFVAAMRRDHVWALQFHPELSGSFGKNILERWLASCEGGQAGGARVERS